MDELPAAMLEALPVPAAWRAGEGEVQGNAAFRTALHGTELSAGLLAAPDGVHLVRLGPASGVGGCVYRVRIRTLALNDLRVYLFEDVQGFHEDPLTGLNDRRALLLDTRHGVSGSVALLDMDDFKAVNDTLGHAAGDAALRALADVLRGAEARHGLRAYRLAGDEFVLISPSDGLDHPTLTALQLRFREVATAQGFARLGFSYGLAQAPRDGTTLTELLHRADVQLHRRKGHAHGHGRLRGPLERAAAELRQFESGLNRCLRPEPELCA